MIRDKQAARPWLSADERHRWYHTPTDHGGLALQQMSSTQQSLAMQLLATGLSHPGYVTAPTTAAAHDRAEARAGFRPEHDDALALTMRPKGFAASEMSARQQDRLRNLLTTFVERIPAELTARQAQKFDGDRLHDVHFAWAVDVAPGSRLTTGCRGRGCSPSATTPSAMPTRCTRFGETRGAAKHVVGSEAGQPRTTCPWINSTFIRFLFRVMVDRSDREGRAMDRALLADFLRARREALQPEDVGLARGSRRRTSGLRREEVAGFAGMSDLAADPSGGGPARRLHPVRRFVPVPGLPRFTDGSKARELDPVEDHPVRGRVLHEVGVIHHHDLKRYRHPELGEMELYCQPLVDPEQSQELLVFTAMPGSSSYEKLQLLGAVAGQAL